MAGITPDPRKRGYLLPPGCKDLADVIKPARRKKPDGAVRVNGQIRASHVDVRDAKGQAIGTMALVAALKMAKQQGLDLVEVNAHASPPTCILIDYGLFQYRRTKPTKPTKPKKN